MIWGDQAPGSHPIGEWATDTAWCMLFAENISFHWKVSGKHNLRRQNALSKLLTRWIKFYSSIFKEQTTESSEKTIDHKSPFLGKRTSLEQQKVRTKESQTPDLAKFYFSEQSETCKQQESDT